MNTRDRLYGAFYIATFFIFSPLILGGLIATLIYSFSGYWLPFLLLYGFGIALTAVPTTLLYKRTYISNPLFICSHHIDPITKRLICRPPGFHFVRFDEQFDSYTRHERELKIVAEGTFETFGKKTLNIKVTKATLVLEVPVETASTLRGIGKGMGVPSGEMIEIQSEIEEQLKPALLQAIAAEFAIKQPEQLMRNPDAISESIMQRFIRTTLIRTRYAAFPASFSLGDLGFSDKINDAREEAFAMDCHQPGIKKLAETLGNSELAGKLYFGSREEDGLKVTVYDVSGLEGLGGIGALVKDAKDIVTAVTKPGQKQPSTKPNKKKTTP